MTDISEHNDQSVPSAFAGLRPNRGAGDPDPRDDSDRASRRQVSRDQNRVARSLFATVPIVLVGSLAVAGMTMSGVVEPASDRVAHKPKSSTAHSPTSVKDALAAANAGAVSDAATAASAAPAELSVASAPGSYEVQGGDTVSGIAGRFGLSTASVLALNGLGWKSAIFPGQVLKLSNAVSSPSASVVPAEESSPSATTSYTITSGDTVTSIARQFGTTASAILAANALDATSVIYAGRTLTIPGAGTPAPAAASASAPASAAATYTIQTGDTISAIAKQFGFTVPDLLAANNLTLSSIIYSGQSLVVSAPVAITPAISVQPLDTAQSGDSVTPLSDEMEDNARTIVRVGEGLGVPDYGIVIALAAAMQESSLRNLDHGDRDSVGLFQQRPSTEWGEKKQLLDPEYAARLFFGGPDNPNKGVTLGLLEIPGWESMPVTQAAQSVQISAHPDAYAKWEFSARVWLASLK